MYMNSKCTEPSFNHQKCYHRPKVSSPCVDSIHKVVAFHWGLQCASERNGAGIIYQDVNATKFLHCLFDSILYLLLNADVNDARQCFAACFFHWQKMDGTCNKMPGYLLTMAKTMTLQCILHDTHAESLSLSLSLSRSHTHTHMHTQDTHALSLCSILLLLLF